MVGMGVVHQEQPAFAGHQSEVVDLPAQPGLDMVYKPGKHLRSQQVDYCLGVQIAVRGGSSADAHSLCWSSQLLSVLGAATTPVYPAGGRVGLIVMML